MYTETEEMKQKRVKAFKYHPPKENQIERYGLIRNTANLLAAELNENCPESREKSLAMTKLEEVVMWANAAIARNETGNEEREPVDRPKHTPTQAG